MKKTQLVQYKNYETLKKKGCLKLAQMNIKKITNKEILKVAKELGIPSSVLKNAWRVCQETGGQYFDRRVRTHSGTLHFTTKIKRYNKIRYVSAKQAGDIILEYMNNSNLNSRQICTKYKIGIKQFYSWLHELEVKGTLLGKRVLDPNKYAKLRITDVIWLYRYPETKRKSIKRLTVLERAQYQRVATILQRYLPHTKGKGFLTRGVND